MNSLTPQSLRQSLSRHILPLAMAIISIAIALGGDAAKVALQYQAQAIQNGEWWRLITGNFVHLGFGHLVMNLLGLALIWSLLRESFSILAWIIITITSTLAVSFGLLLLSPEIHWYVGLSGLLHGIFVAGLVGGLRRGDWREATLLAAVALKLIWEQYFGPLPGSAEMADGPVVTVAHLYGAMGGLIAGLLCRPRMWC
ncbi:MAG: rhombosortase [Gammaproteobacteria bacterium]|nr:rhombosortase [Gammaproteobacteria bacterium]